jgi:hypothetical protein
LGENRQVCENMHKSVCSAPCLRDHMQAYYAVKGPGCLKRQCFRSCVRRMLVNFKVRQFRGTSATRRDVRHVCQVRGFTGSGSVRAQIHASCKMPYVIHPIEHRCASPRYPPASLTDLYTGLSCRCTCTCCASARQTGRWELAVCTCTPFRYLQFRYMPIQGRGRSRVATSQRRGISDLALQGICGVGWCLDQSSDLIAIARGHTMY